MDKIREVRTGNPSPMFLPPGGGVAYAVVIVYQQQHQQNNEALNTSEHEFIAAC